MLSDPLMTLAGLGVGFVVGLTGMGGGALMTPVLVLLFGVQPLAAVSSDLVAAVVMKPIGSAVHFKHGTVDVGLVKWLALGSVPAAFGGVLVLRAAGGAALESAVRTSLGAALILAVALMVLRAALGVRRGLRERRLGLPPAPPRGDITSVRVRRGPTVLVGAVGGLVVGMTSVGSGSLVIVSLLFLYPTLRANELVGTDLAQAIPLVASAALGHLLFGDFQLGLTLSILLGSVPGVYIGARVSTRAPARLVRRALMVVLFMSGLKLIGVSTLAVGVLLLGCVVLVPVAWTELRIKLGLPRRPPEPAAATG
jgi:uncharacterized membrane protein YfcA